MLLLAFASWQIAIVLNLFRCQALFDVEHKQRVNEFFGRIADAKNTQKKTNEKNSNDKLILDLDDRFFAKYLSQYSAG